MGGRGSMPSDDYFLSVTSTQLGWDQHPPAERACVRAPHFIGTDCVALLYWLHVILCVCACFRPVANGRELLSLGALWPCRPDGGFALQLL